MAKMLCVLLLLATLLTVLALTAQPAAAQGYTNVASLEPWSPQSNYMSLAGYLRWMTFREQKVWLSMAEAKRIVAEQLSQT